MYFQSLGSIEPIGEGDPTFAICAAGHRDGKPDGMQLELARAMASGDHKSVGEISMLRSIAYIKEEEARPSGGPRFDSNSPLLRPYSGLDQYHG